MPLSWKVGDEILLVLSYDEGDGRTEHEIAHIYKRLDGMWEGIFVNFTTKPVKSLQEAKTQLLSLIRHISRVLNYQTKLGQGYLVEE